MALDLTTLYAVAALVALVAGIVHVVPWATGRFGRWSGYWGLGHLMMGSSTLLGILHDRHMVAEELIRLGNPVAIVGYAYLFAGVRHFELPKAPVWPFVAIAVVLGMPLFVCIDPADFPYRVAYMNIIRALFDVAIVCFAVRLARREQFHTGWIIATLFAATIPLFLGRGWLAATGQIGPRLTGMHDDLAAWLAAGQIAFVIFRAFSLLILEAERGQKALAEQICRDPLTGAFNRLGFERLCTSLSGPVCLMMIDIDHFKPLNDRHGHAAGDEALRILARVAREVLGRNGALIRWGGDEFLCLLPNATAADAGPVAAAISARFTAAARMLAAGSCMPTLSIGHADGLAETDIDDLLLRADAAMYVAKSHRGRSAAAHAHASAA